MKKIIALIAIAISFSAAAQPKNDTLARYAFHIQSTDEGSTYALVKYIDGGILVVDEYAYTWESGFQGEFIGSSEVYLPELVADRLLGSIKTLANAEVVEHTAEVVCMMMPMPGPSRDLLVRRDWNWQTNEFAGELSIVQTNSGCWDPYSVTPVAEWHKAEARSLMSSLEIATLMGIAK